jgi:hypothetical protein
MIPSMDSCCERHNTAVAIYCYQTTILLFDQDYEECCVKSFDHKHVAQTNEIMDEINTYVVIVSEKVSP